MSRKIIVDCTQKLPGRVVQSVAEQVVPGSIPGPATYFLLPADSRRAVVGNWRKYVHLVLVNLFGGLSLPRKSVVRISDRPDMTLAVYRGRNLTTTTQGLQSLNL